MSPQVFSRPGAATGFGSVRASAAFAPSAGILGGETGALAGLLAMVSEAVLGESVMMASLMLGMQSYCDLGAVVLDTAEARRKATALNAVPFGA